MEDSFLLTLYDRYVSGSICQNEDDEDELRKVFEEEYIDRTIDLGCQFKYKIKTEQASNE